jgi:hypothetical protein
MNKEEAKKRLQNAGFQEHQAAMILATIELALSEFKTERLKLFMKAGLSLVWVIVAIEFLYAAFELGKHYHP